MNWNKNRCICVVYRTKGKWNNKLLYFKEASGCHCGPEYYILGRASEVLFRLLFKTAFQLRDQMTGTALYYSCSIMGVQGGMKSK